MNLVATDEQILYDAYRRLALKKPKKVNNIDITADKALTATMVSRSSLVITQLSGAQPVVSVQKIVMKAKAMYTHYARIKHRNPSCVSASLDRNMDTMIREVCKREADMIADLRVQEIDGNGIDIQQILSERRYQNRLATESVRRIVQSAIYSEEANKYVRDLFITKKGKKFHRADCPFCKNANLIPVSRELVESRGLLPCKCLGIAEQAEDRGCITVFIDESLHQVKWNEEGEQGVAGNYSYVICRGNLAKETEITDENTVAQGVEYSSEQRCVDKITREAIEKVLTVLSYTYGFVGEVRIYTDNLTVARNWKNENFASRFVDVIVNYIPREENRIADRLCRNRIILNIPAKTYSELVANVARVGELEERIKELETQVEHQSTWFYRVISYIRMRLTDITLGKNCRKEAV